MRRWGRDGKGRARDCNGRREGKRSLLSSILSGKSRKGCKLAPRGGGETESDLSRLSQTKGERVVYEVRKLENRAEISRERKGPIRRGGSKRKVWGGGQAK